MYVQAPPRIRSTRPWGVSIPSYATDPTTTMDIDFIVVAWAIRAAVPDSHATMRGVAMLGKPHYLPQLIIWLICSVLLVLGMFRYRRNRAALAVLLIAEAWVSAGLLVTPVRVSTHLPVVVNLVARAGFVIIAVCSVFGAVIELMWAAVPQFNPRRRAALKAATFAAPAVALGVGYL